jgi:hypothetical protein
MKLKYIEFSEPQLERIYEFINNLNNCNTNPMSNCKVSGIDMRVDSKNNFFCSYLMEMLGSGDGVQLQISYAEIKSDGIKINLLDVYRTENEIIHVMDKMKKIEI